MKWKRYAIADYPDDLWHDWDVLNARYCRFHPLLQSHFVRPLTKHFPAEIEVLAGYCNGECAALVLLERSRGIIQRPYLPGQSQIALLLAPPEFSLNQSYRECMPTTACRIDILSIDSLYQPELSKLNRSQTTIRGSDMVIKIDDDFTGYWTQRPKNLRKNILRYKNRIHKELGSSHFKIVSSPQDIDQAVSRYGLMESHGWKGVLGTAIHPENTQGKFYREIMHAFSESGNALVFELWSQNVLVASRLCIRNDSLLIILKTTFNEDYKKFAFGRILLFESLQYIFEKRLVDTVDLYTNATKDQLDWATESRPIYNTSLYWGMGGKIVYALSRAKQLAHDMLNGKP